MRIPMEDWLRGCVYHDGRHGEVTLSTDKVLEIANYIQLTRTSLADGMIELPPYDRKTEPKMSEKPTGSEPQTEMPRCSVNGTPFDECGFCEYFNCDTCKCEADVPQTERIKTPDYCDICNHKGCRNCVANSLDDYCVPSGYEPITKTETQNSNLTFEKRTMRDCYNCKKYEAEGECIECKFEPKDEPQTDCAWK